MDRAAAPIWADPDEPGVCLLTLGLDRYGVGALNWHPDTWAQELTDDCGAPPSWRALHRLLAACALYTNPDEFYASAAGFCDLARALAADWFDTAVFDPPSAEECARAVVEAHLIAPPLKGQAFSPEVVRLVHLVCRDEGLPELPAVFRSFGVGDDHGLPPPHDYESDPDLAAAAAAGTADREADLAAAVSEFLRDVAARLARLPLRGADPRPVAAELLARAGGE